MYDWILFFNELTKKAIENKTNIKEIARSILGEDHALLQWPIDPFTFIYVIASRNSEKNFIEIKRILDIESPVPQDRIFPTPRGNSNRGFHYNSGFSPLSEEEMWDFFEQSINAPHKNSIAELFEGALKIGNVDITKLTQALFLINPEYFIPIDDRTAILFPNKTTKELKNVIRNDGFSGYQELMSQLKTRFKGCEFWEMNRLAYAIVGENLKPDFDNWWYQISSQWDGEGEGDFIDKWFEDSSIAIGHTEGDFLETFKNVSKGNIVIAKKGMSIFHGIGVILNNSITSAIDARPITRDILWILKDKSKDIKHFNRVTICQTQKEEVYEQISDFYPEIWNFLSSFSSKNQSEPTTVIGENNMSLNFPKNQILYGPPGTGKTYSTIDEALKICDVEIDDWSDRKELKSNFDRLVSEGRIVFTTFHQSMSYEDFIEGIKPVLEDSTRNEVSYKIEKGLFSKIAIKSLYSIISENEDFAGKSSEILDFSTAYDQYIAELEESLTSKEAVQIKTRNGHIIVDSISEQRNLSVTHPGRERRYTVSKNRLSQLQKVFKDVNQVKNIDLEFRVAIGGSNSTCYWAVLKEVQKYIKNNNSLTKKEKSLTNPSYDDMEQYNENFIDNDFSVITGKPHVLIIDEINRGNISAIFGELITLIEDDKRLGASEELKVDLPYSKKKFCVPSNLYIIGTMNTADRSVESLDAALRRRFSFTEIMPEPELLAKDDFSGLKIAHYENGINLKEMLIKINSRIEKLKDRDHTIGHSYFYSLLKFNDGEDLRQELINIFKNKIIPLLEEYFYGDWEKIGMILGNSFVEKVENNIKFASGFDESSDYDEISYAITESTDWNFVSIYE